jgi:hypothetical protein
VLSKFKCPATLTATLDLSGGVASYEDGEPGLYIRVGDFARRVVDQFAQSHRLNFEVQVIGGL